MTNRKKPGIGTKIVATIGPASSESTTIEKLYQAGVDGFRINCSHTKAEEIPAIVANIRKHGEGFVIADLAGLKLRNREPMRGVAGDSIEIRRSKLTHKIAGIEKRARVLFGDGTVAGTVAADDGETFSVELDADLEMPSNSALHIAGAEISGSCVEEADLAHLEAAIAAGCEWIALSYVRDGLDAQNGAGIVAGRAGVIAKIERASAIEDLEGIFEHVDAVMVARGDLGVDLPYTKVPAAQRSIYRRCREHGIPVVCATEMMQSMIHSTRPTRAEVGDVEAVIRYGYDALVFTAETAMGKHPVLVIETAAAIRSVTEANYGPTPEKTTQTDAALAYAAAAFADRIGADRIVALTAGGHTAKLISGARSSTGVIAVSPDPHIVRRIGLYHGIKARTLPRNGGVEENAATTLQHLVENGDIEKGATCVLIGSRVGPDHAADIMMVRNA